MRLQYYKSKDLFIKINLCVLSIDFTNSEINNVNVTDKPLLYCILAQAYTKIFQWQEAKNEIQKIDDILSQEYSENIIKWQKAINEIQKIANILSQTYSENIINWQEAKNEIQKIDEIISQTYSDRLKWKDVKNEIQIIDNIISQAHSRNILKWSETKEEIQIINNTLSQAYSLNHQYKKGKEEIHRIKSIQDVINLLKCKSYIATQSYNNALNIFSIICKNENNEFFVEALKSWICTYFENHEVPIKFLSFIEEAEKITPNLLNNYCISNVIDSIYTKQRIKVPATIRKNLWMYPNSLDLIKDSSKYIKDFNISESDYLKKYEHISNLYKKRPWEYNELKKYLIHSISQHESGIKCSDIGLLYMQLLFEVNEFDSIIESAEQDAFVLKYKVSHEYQLYYFIRAIQRSTVRLYDQYGSLSNNDDIKNNIKKLETKMDILKKDDRFKWLAKALSKMAETCYLVGMLDRANYWWNELIEKFNNSKEYSERIEVDEARWMKVFILIEQNKLEQAIEEMNNTLKSYFCYDLENQARLRYWQGWLYRKLGKQKEYKNSWIKLLKKYPNTFYGLTLAKKEKNLFLRAHYNDKNNILCSNCEQASPYQQSLLKKWKLLLMIGEKKQVDYEIKEFFKLEKNRQVICDFHVKIFNLLNEYSLYNRSVKLINKYYLEKIIRVPINKHKPLWKFTYPLVHKEYINKEFINNLDEPKKFLIHAIMRSESKFNPFSVSNAGAVGLLQLTIQTAREEAKQFNITIKSINELFDIEKNIQIGSAHIKRLLNQYKNIYQVIGAYNAGRPKMNEWIRESKKVTEDTEYFFIEKIPYRETRNYIKSTVKDYDIYNHIYGNNSINAM